MSLSAEEMEWLQHLERSIDAIDGGRHPLVASMSADDHLAQRRKRFRPRFGGGSRGSAADDGNDMLAVADPLRPLTPHGAVVGVLWAIQDHPRFAAGSAHAICNAVRATGRTRFAPWAVLDAALRSPTSPEALRRTLLSALPELLVVVLPAVIVAAVHEQRTSGGGDSTSDKKRGARGGADGQQRGGTAVTSGGEAVFHAALVCDTLRAWQQHPEAIELAAAAAQQQQQHVLTPQQLQTARDIAEELRIAIATAGDRLRFELHVSAHGGDSLVAGGGSSATVAAPSAEQYRVKAELSTSMSTAGGGGLGGGGGVSTVATELDALKKEAVAKVLEAMAATRAPTAAAAAASGSSTSSAVARLAAAAAAQNAAAAAAGAHGHQNDSSKNAASTKVDWGVATGHALVRQIQASTRVGDHACSMCGAYFDNAAAKRAHERVHFAWRRHQQHVRLPPLTEAQFCRYDCNHGDGGHVPTIAALQESSAVTHKSADRLTRKIIAD